MKAWEFGLVLIVASILLSIWVYYDAKSANSLPWYVIFVDLLLFLLGLLIIRFGRKW